MTDRPVANIRSLGTPICHPNDNCRSASFNIYAPASVPQVKEYVELHTTSAFSFLDGASQPESLIERAIELDMPAIALADRNGLYGAARFHTSAKRNGV